MYYRVEKLYSKAIHSSQWSLCELTLACGIMPKCGFTTDSHSVKAFFIKVTDSLISSYLYLLSTVPPSGPYPILLHYILNISNTLTNTNPFNIIKKFCNISLDIIIIFMMVNSVSAVRGRIGNPGLVYGLLV